jgi:hemerythrin-like domain-containing protein
MKRDVRLHGLTSDHHHALVLARRLREAAARGGLDLILLADVRRRYIEELGPHFALEEEELLPALEQVGRTDLVARTLRDHEALRNHLAAAESGDLSRLSEFGALLEAHVRFEERDLFTACEALVGPEVLTRVALRAPKGKRPGYPNR